MTSILQEESNLLFRAYQEGNTAALGELYIRWHEFVIQKVRNTNVFSASDVEDISSNVWVLVQKQAHTWDIDRSGWYLFLKYKIRLAVSTEIRRRRLRLKILKDKGYIEFQEVSDDSYAPIGVMLASSMDTDTEPSPLEALIESERQETLEKAIRVCDFPPIAEKILRLRLKGMTVEAIQKALGLKQASCVGIHLKRTLEDLKEVINPTTFEVSTVAPKLRRKREKRLYLKQTGKQLKMCFRKKRMTLSEISRAVRIDIVELERFIEGKRKPLAPRLFRLASVLGDEVYDIYLPPLHRARWSKQGQTLWRMRVKQGLSLRKVSQKTGLDYSLLTQYEAGELKMSQEAEQTLAKFFAEMCR